MGVLDRIRELLGPGLPPDDPEADERRQAAPREAEPGPTSDAPARPDVPAPHDDDWLSNRERLGPGV